MQIRSIRYKKKVINKQEKRVSCKKRNKFFEETILLTINIAPVGVGAYGFGDDDTKK